MTSLEQAAVALERLRQDPTNEAQWESLYRSFKPYLLTVAYRQLAGDRHAAEDVVHEAFLKLAAERSFERFATPEALRGYLAKTIRNTVIDRWRLRRPEVPLAADSKEGSEPLPDEAHQVRALLSELTPPERALTCMLLEGRTLTEIAAGLRISYSAAGVRVHRLRKHLRNLFPSRGKDLT